MVLNGTELEALVQQAIYRMVLNGTGWYLITIRLSRQCAALTTKQSLRKPADNRWFSFCGGLTGHATDAKIELTNWLIVLCGMAVVTIENNIRE